MAAVADVVAAARWVEVAAGAEAPGWAEVAAGWAVELGWVEAVIDQADMAVPWRVLHRCRDRLVRRLAVQVAALRLPGIAWQMRARPTVIFRRRAFREAEA